jgi:hypothetical protein
MTASKVIKDKVRQVGDYGVAAGGASLGAMAAGTLASISGATAIPFVTSAASMLGITAVAATPIGWLIGATVAGGSLAFGISRLIKNGAHAEGQLSEIEANKRYQKHIEQTRLNAISLSKDELDNITQLMDELVRINALSEAFSTEMIALVKSGDISVNEATETLQEFKCDITSKQAKQSETEYKVLEWLLTLQVEQGVLSEIYKRELLSHVQTRIMSETEALKSLESYLSNFGFFYILAPVLYKIAVVDNQLHPAEIHVIGDFFINELGFSKRQVDQASEQILKNIDQVELDDFVKSLSLYIDHCYEKNHSQELKQNIVTLLERVVAADGVVDTEERHQLDIIIAIFNFYDNNKLEVNNVSQLDDFAKQQLVSDLMHWKDELMINVIIRLYNEIPHFIKHAELLLNEIPLTLGWIRSEHKKEISVAFSSALIDRFKAIVVEESKKNSQPLDTLKVKFNYIPTTLVIDLDVVTTNKIKHLINEGVLNVQRKWLLNQVNSNISWLFSTDNENSYINQLRDQVNEFQHKAMQSITS